MAPSATPPSDARSWVDECDSIPWDTQEGPQLSLWMGPCRTDLVVSGPCLSSSMEAGSSVVIEVEDLDDSALLEAASEAERRDREVQLDKLRIAHEWCLRHPATPESGTATWGDAGLPGLADCDASLGGDGTPGVAPFVAEELGAAMGVSTQSAMSLMADALDLRHRFPQLWAEGGGRRGCPMEDPPGRCRDPLAALRGGSMGR